MNKIEKFIRELNGTWTSQRYDDLYHFFDEHVRMPLPDSSESINGVEAMVQSYRQFGSTGTLHQFSIINIKTYLAENIAIAHMKFFVDYEIDNGRHQENGIDMYVINASSTPKILWRSQINLDEVEGYAHNNSLNLE